MCGWNLFTSFWLSKQKEPQFKKQENYANRCRNSRKRMSELLIIVTQQKRQKSFRQNVRFIASACLA